MTEQEKKSKLPGVIMLLSLIITIGVGIYFRKEIGITFWMYFGLILMVGFAIVSWFCGIIFQTEPKKTNSQTLGFSLILFVAFGSGLYEQIYWNNGGSDSEIKSEEDIKKWIDERADKYCSKWKTAENMNNHNNRVSEKIKIRSLVFAFKTEIRGKIESTDLKDDDHELYRKLVEHFENRMRDCGYNESIE